MVVAWQWPVVLSARVWFLGRGAGQEVYHSRAGSCRALWKCSAATAMVSLDKIIATGAARRLRMMALQETAYMLRRMVAAAHSGMRSVRGTREGISQGERNRRRQSEQRRVR